jgi:pyrroline-5-carboxylate reductase
MISSSDNPIILIGAGNMGGAMALGWIRSGIAASAIIAADPNPPPAMLEKLLAAGIEFSSGAPEGVIASVIFIAVKPQVMDKVLPAYHSLIGPDTVVISIAAGKTLAFIEAHLGAAAMVRAMPNTPAMIGRGVTGAFANGQVSDSQKVMVDGLLKVSGPVEWVESEALIDAVTAVSGSGPAYVFYLVECMAEAGRKVGLPADLAMRLARATVSGAGELLHQSPDEAAILRQNVTSPGGTTAAALSVLMGENGIQPLYDAAIKAARDRAEQLAG